jgi:hypothetical protein
MALCSKRTCVFVKVDFDELATFKTVSVPQFCQQEGAEFQVHLLPSRSSAST